MANLAALLGDKLLGKSGEIATGDAIKGKKAVALHFSAHWCPPCRGFTPKLAEWYTKDLKDKGLEVVFISSDRDEKAFDEYYGEQPWLSVPYASREVKANLDKKFKIQGIPSLIILSPDGEVITKDGRAAVSEDPEGLELPWKPKSFEEIFSDATLITQDGSTVKGSSLKGKVFGLYFSAHWCPPCRGFTPQLAEWYKKDLKAKDFEIVFVSSDSDESSFKEYFVKCLGWHLITVTARGKNSSVNYLKCKVFRALLSLIRTALLSQMTVKLLSAATLLAQRCLGIQSL
jgi:nucleoredoxin